MDWVVVNIARLVIAGLWLLSGGGFLLATGGGLAFLVIDIGASLLRWRDRSGERVSARLVLLSYVLVILNFWLGVGQIWTIRPFIWLIVTSVIIYAGFTLMFSLGIVVAPHERIRNRLAFVSLLALFGFPAVWAVRFALSEMQSTTGDSIGLLAAGTIAVVGMVVWLVMKTQARRDSRVLLTRPVSVLGVVSICLIFGVVFELVRGYWAVWFVSFMALVETMDWAWTHAATLSQSDLGST